MRWLGAMCLHRTLLMMALLAAASLPSFAVTQVIYPAPETANDNRYRDLIELLDTALKRTSAEYGPYQLQPSDIQMNEARYLVELKAGHLINVAWSSTSNEKERDYLPIRIPLRKSLLGYRVALIARDMQDKVDRIKTVEDLRRFTVGQGIGWGDAQVYQANGIRLQRSSYGDLFYLTAQHKVQLFPRGIGEIGGELAAYQATLPDLVVEKNLLIYYPWPYYFFFNRRDSLLAARVEKGLRMMLADGSFDRLFWRYNGAAIEQAHLKNRRVITLVNPLLPKATPLNDTKLWFDLRLAKPAD